MLPISHNRAYRWGLSLAGIVVFFVTWHLLTDVFGIFHQTVLPAPLDIWNEFWRVDEVILENTPETVKAAGIGFVLAVVLGIVSAILFTLNDRIQEALMPFVVGGNSIPRVALAPLFVFYLGEGITALYALAAWIAFFPMFINAFDGFARIDEDERKMLTLFGASRWQEYRYVRIPNGLPRVFDGMKISVILAMIGAIVGEFVMVGGGLGNLGLLAMNTINTPLVFAVVIVAGAISTFAIFIVYLIQVKVIFWEDVNFFTAEM